MMTIQYEAVPVPTLLIRESARSSPFLTDGEELYLVEGWRAEGAPRKRIRARRLSKAERSIVEHALRDAAEEAAYRLFARAGALTDRARRARPGRA
jgi:hypothetical protein